MIFNKRVSKTFISLVFICFISSSTFMIFSFTNTNAQDQGQITDKILSVNEKSLPGDKVSATEISLPPKIYAIVGKEINIYFENILNDKAEKYDFTVKCNIGMQQSDRWTCKPTSPGTYNLSISVYNQNSFICSASTDIIVSNPNTNTEEKSFLAIGDSTTVGSIYTGEMLKLASSDKIKLSLIGTKGTGSNKFEGFSGWTISKFFESPQSPFVYNGVFDFKKYMESNKLNNPDFVLINLGINDVMSFEDDEKLIKAIPEIIKKLQAMTDSIKSYNNRINIGIAVTIPPSKSQDAFGESYGCQLPQWRCKRNNFIWNKELISEFDSKESQGIYLVPINVNLDTVNNMQVKESAINSRNPNKVIRQSNGVHPGFTGYYQIADEIYYWLRSF